MKENTEKLKKLAEELFSLMSVSATIEVVYNKEDEIFEVNVDASDATGLLIGKRGDTLLSIQNILSVLYKTKVGEWVKIVVNIGDYREKEEEYLRNLANTTADRAIETGMPQNLYNLKSWQRRVIHMALSENKKITTTSEGEGNDRYLIISPTK